MIYKYNNFINEISTTPKPTPYDEFSRPSIFYGGIDLDYLLKFKVNNRDYVIILFFYNNEEIKSHEILFTTLDNFRLFEIELSKLDPKNISDEDHDRLRIILESETNFGDFQKVMSSVSFIIRKFFKEKLEGTLLSLSNTNREIKIIIYRELIRNSFDDIEETEHININTNKKIYYYKIT